MTVPAKPSTIQQPAPGPQDPVARNLEPEKPDRLERAMKAKDDAIAREKAANDLLQQSLQNTQQLNEQLREQNQRMLDEASAMRDLVANQIESQQKLGEPAVPQPGKATEVDITNLLNQHQEKTLNSVKEVLAPFAAKIADMSANEDRRTFDKLKGAEFGQTFGLSDDQHAATKDIMKQHGTLQYAQAAALLPGELAIKRPEPSVTQPQPQLPAAQQPATLTPQPRTPAPAATTPTARIPEPTKEYSKEEIIQAANNARSQGNKREADAILYKRITEGTQDPHNQFGGHFTGQKQEKPAGT